VALTAFGRIPIGSMKCRASTQYSPISRAAIRYHSSQPWPFPSNIMLGFIAEARTSELEVDGEELEDARWFVRDRLNTHANDDTFRLPRRDSIARRLVEDWLSGAL
jgi:NAD+ diphosphatase